MKKEIKKLWVRALRSGKYVKGKGMLKTKKGYCCLGVLTDLYIKEKKLKKGWESHFEPEDGELGLRVMRWAGLPSKDPEVEFKKHGSYEDKQTLSVINDTTRKTFKDIAGIIQEQL